MMNDTVEDDLKNRIADLERQVDELEARVRHYQADKEAVEDELRENHYRCRMLLETIPDQMFVLSREGRILDFQTREKRAERDQRRHEAQYRNLYARAPIGIFRTTSEGKALDINATMARMLGFETPEAAVAYYTDLGDQLYVDPAARHDFLRRLRTEGRVDSFEHEARTRDGRSIWLSVNARRVQSTPDGAFFIEGFAIDITQRKQAEKALWRRTEIMTAILDNVPVMIVYLDGEGRFRLANRCFEETMGWSLAEIRTFDVWEALYPDPNYRREVMDFIASSAGNWGEFQPLTRDGRVLDTLWANIPLQNGSNIGIGLDITGRKRAEKALHEALLRQKEAVRAGNVGLWDWNPETDEVLYSAEWKRQIGYADHEIGNHMDEWLRRVHPDDLEPTLATIRKCVADGASRQAEFRFRHKDGSYRWILARASMLRDESGNPTRLFGSNIDITERKQIEGRLLQAQKMESIGNLAGGIAHDFNNILFPIIGLAEMLMEDLPADSLQRDSAREIFEAGKRGGELVKQILTFSRQTDQQKLPLPIQKVLKEVLKLCHATIPADIAIIQRIQQDCGAVMANPTQIHQIAMNLMTNAYHAVEPNHGEIRVVLQEVDLDREPWPGSALDAGRHVLLSVADTGCGIDPADLRKIFEPYFTTKTQDKGTGLGLAVVYGIVKEHGGDIRVSTTLGKGTTFQVYLPVLDQAAEKKPAEAPPSLPTGSEHILLVDDEAAVMRIERRMLESLGYRVSTCTDSREALAAFRAHPEGFDLVLTDMTMPRMTGDHLARELMAIRPDLPVVLCTGFSERITPDMAGKLRIKGFLLKPVIKSQLATTIRTALDNVKDAGAGKDVCPPETSARSRETFLPFASAVPGRAALQSLMIRNRRDGSLCEDGSS